MDIQYKPDRPLGFQRISGLAASTALTVPAGTRLVLICCEAQAVRWRDDGVDPTAAIGYPLAVGSELQYTGFAASQLRFIEQAASAVLNAVYYG